MRYINNIKRLGVFCFLLLLMFGCYDIPMDNEQYKKQIYIVNSDASDPHYSRELMYDTELSETFIAVASSGSLPQDHDVQIELAVVDSLVDNYNELFFENQIDKYYTVLPRDKYVIDNFNLTLKAGGEIYTRLPIKVDTKGLDRDVKYVIPIKIISASHYEINTEISYILYGFDMINQYSGYYTMFGKKIIEGEEKPTVVAGSREFWAVSHNTIRCFIDMKTEDSDNLDVHAIHLTVEGDKITIKAHNESELQIIDSGLSRYNSTTKVFTLNYQYLDTGTDEYVGLELNLTLNED